MPRIALNVSSAFVAQPSLIVLPIVALVNPKQGLGTPAIPSEPSYSQQIPSALWLSSIRLVLLGVKNVNCLN